MEFMYLEDHTDNTAPFFIVHTSYREIEINSTVNVIMKHGSLSFVELSSPILDIGVCNSVTP